MKARYAKFNELASRVIRKDASFMTLNNYDIVVKIFFNTFGQRWRMNI